jgi:HEAT repeat protein
MPYWQVVPPAQLATTLLTSLNKEKDTSIKSKIISDLGNVGSSLIGSKEKQLVVTELIREMENNTGAVYSAAVTALGKIRLQSATEPLLKQLKLHTSISYLVQEIIFSLGEIRDARAVEDLVIFLEKHGSVGVRSQAATALGKIGGPKAIGALKGRLTKETDKLVKDSISKALTVTVGPLQTLFR